MILWFSVEKLPHNLLPKKLGQQNSLKISGNKYYEKKNIFPKKQSNSLKFLVVLSEDQFWQNW